MHNINIALFQTNASFKSKNEMFAQVEKMILNNKDKKIDLICFPELFATNVNIVNLDNVAEEDNGETFQLLSRMAKEQRAFIVAGILEKSESKYYNTALLINDNGELIGKHRKISLNVFENNFLEMGVEINTFNTSLGKIGIIIGNDLNSLEILNRLAIENVDIIVCLTQAPVQYSCVVENVAISRVMDIPAYLLISSNVGTSNISRIEFKGVTSVLYSNIDDLLFKTVEDFVLDKIESEEVGVLNVTIDSEKYRDFKKYSPNLIMHKEISEILKNVKELQFS